MEDFKGKIGTLIEQEIAYYKFTKASSVKVLNKEINLFLKNLQNKSLVSKFKTEIKKIKNYGDLDKFIQCIANYNYQAKFNYKKEKNEGIRFFLICASIETFYKLNENSKGDSKKTFKKFFSFGKTKFKTTIKAKYVVSGKTFNDNSNYEEYVDYLYNKRNELAHEGTHFSFCKSGGLFDRFTEKNYSLEFKQTFDEFILMFEEILLLNLREANQ